MSKMALQQLLFMIGGGLIMIHEKKSHRLLPLGVSRSFMLCVKYSIHPSVSPKYPSITEKTHKERPNNPIAMQTRNKNSATGNVPRTK